MAILAVDTRAFTSEAELIGHYRKVRARLRVSLKMRKPKPHVTLANLIIAAVFEEIGVTRTELLHRKSFPNTRVGCVFAAAKPAAV
jgi:hypothetical protein